MKPFFTFEYGHWKLSRNWAMHILDCCTDKGIQRCKGACCFGNGFWPGSASKSNICEFLGGKGCILPVNDRPVTCRLFPFVLNTNNTLVVNMRALMNGRCSPNHNKGNHTILECQEISFISLFGEYEWKKMLENIKKGDTFIKVPMNIILELKREKELIKYNKPYIIKGK